MKRKGDKEEVRLRRMVLPGYSPDESRMTERKRRKGHGMIWVCCFSFLDVDSEMFGFQ